MRIFTLFLAAVCIGFLACEEPHSRDEKLLLKIDSLTQQVKKLEQLMSAEDSAHSEQSDHSKSTIEETKQHVVRVSQECRTTEKPTTQEVSPPMKTQPPRTEAPAKQSVKQTEDTIRHYYKGSKNLSLLITPWKDMKRKLIFYNPFGAVTYEIEDANMSYTSITEIKSFHSNGAVERIHIDLNPGASMYWYDTQITFDINNNPLWKESNKHPSSLAEMMDNRSYWDKSCSCWKKQEVIKEQPVPQPDK